jgi:pantetheine-phosphate adenylyltransferase
MKTALFAGTFDPPTLGHVDLIQRAKPLCDKLYVGVAMNSTKRETLFSIEERQSMLKTICKPYPYVEIATFSTLVVQFAKEKNVDFLLRGVRVLSDFDYEMRMAFAHRHLSGIETVFLMADEKYSLLSSTIIRELGSYQSRLHHFVPAEIEAHIFKRLSTKGH